MAHPALVRRRYLVECYWPGIDEETLWAAVGRARLAVGQLRRTGRRIELLETILVPSDETVFCFFCGAEADVRAAGRQAGVPFERVLESLHFDAIERELVEAPAMPGRGRGRRVDGRECAEGTSD